VADVYGRARSFYPLRPWKLVSLCLLRDQLLLRHVFFPRELSDLSHAVTNLVALYAHSVADYVCFMGYKIRFAGRVSLLTLFFLISYTSFDSFIGTDLIHNFYINYIKLSSSTCFERHPLIFRRSMMLIVHVCSLWYSHSPQVAVLCTC